jgi:hypothetical protein
MDLICCYEGRLIVEGGSVLLLLVVFGKGWAFCEEWLFVGEAAC